MLEIVLFQKLTIPPSWKKCFYMTPHSSRLFDSYLLSKLLCCEKCLTDSLIDRMILFNPISQDVPKMLLFMKKDYINKRLYLEIMNAASKNMSNRILPIVSFAVFFCDTISKSLFCFRNVQKILDSRTNGLVS